MALPSGRLALRRWAVAVAVAVPGCGGADAEPHPPPSTAPAVASAARGATADLDPPHGAQSPQGPACVRAGGRCAGKAAVEANPSAPCGDGWHRVDAVSTEPRDANAPPCLGIPFGEEACCMPDGGR
ncbi:MAG: hypothetical protein WKG00_36285 [Polyangiaceae bacterium]